MSETFRIDFSWIWADVPEVGFPLSILLDQQAVLFENRRELIRANSILILERFLM